MFPLVLQLNQAGMPVRWIDYQEAVCHYAKGHIAWELGEEDFIVRGGKSRMTGEQTRLPVRPIIAVRNTGDNDGGAKKVSMTPRLTNKNLFNRDRCTCAYCGNVYGVAMLTRDHIVPVSKGGKDTWMNTITACKSCNNYKADKTPDEAGMPLLYAPYIPSHAENLILSNRNILPSQLDFLRPMVNQHSRVFS